MKIFPKILMIILIILNIMYIEDYFAIMIPDSELDPEKFYDIVALARFIESIMEN